jgi:hypothetical protein
VLLACTSDPALPRSGPQDAAPRDAGFDRVDAVISPDSAALDADPDAPDAELDAELEADAPAIEPEPTYTECEASADCVLPEGTVACQQCSDGSQVCPELGCVDRLCVTTARRACPEQVRAACVSDVDCERGPCILHCQGDGRSACRRSACLEGRCAERDWTCGLHGSTCPVGTRAGQECGDCGDGGACVYRVLGCFDRCEKSADCPGEQKCVAGLCELLSCS